MNPLDRIGNPHHCAFGVIIKEGKILLGHRHYKKSEWKEISIWTLPGGKCEQDEKIGDALKREVKEETGISDLKNIAYIGDVPGAQYPFVLSIFACETSEEPRLLEPHKFSEWKWEPIPNYIHGDYGNFNTNAYRMISRYLSSLA